MRSLVNLLALCCVFIMTTVSAEDANNIELLASSCAACHGTSGHSVGGTPALAGLTELHFIEQMTEFTSGQRPSTVMLHHASGYSATEIEKMAKYFASQTKH